MDQTDEEQVQKKAETVSDKDYLSTISNELKVRILEHIDTPEDWFSLEQTCKSFYTLFRGYDSCLQRTLTVDTGKRFSDIFLKKPYYLLFVRDSEFSQKSVILRNIIEIPLYKKVYNSGTDFIHRKPDDRKVITEVLTNISSNFEEIVRKSQSQQKGKFSLYCNLYLELRKIADKKTRFLMSQFFVKAFGHTADVSLCFGAFQAYVKTVIGAHLQLGGAPMLVPTVDEQVYNLTKQFYANPENCLPMEGESEESFRVRLRERATALATQHFDKESLVFITFMADVNKYIDMSI